MSTNSFRDNVNASLNKAKTTSRRVFRGIMWFLLIAGVLFGIGYFVYRNYTISEGSRTGTLFKISKKGVVFKTYEGQLHLAGSVMLTTQSTWDFSAENASVYQELQKYEGKNVKCFYREKVDAFPWQGDTDYIVYKVEPIQ